MLEEKEILVLDGIFLKFSVREISEKLNCSSAVLYKWKKKETTPNYKKFLNFVFAMGESNEIPLQKEDFVKIRKIRNLNQEEFSKVFDCSPTTIKNYERGVAYPCSKYYKMYLELKKESEQ